MKQMCWVFFFLFLFFCCSCKEHPDYYEPSIVRLLLLSVSGAMLAVFAPCTAGTLFKSFVPEPPKSPL